MLLHLNVFLNLETEMRQYYWPLGRMRRCASGKPPQVSLHRRVITLPELFITRQKMPYH